MIPDRRTAAVPTGNAYDKYAARNPVERFLVTRFLRTLDAAVAACDPDVVLEVGMGEGTIASRVGARFPRARLWGVDLPDPELAEHWRVHGLLGVYADAARLPTADASADLVLCVEVLEHVPDPRAALREIARVARGTVVLSVPLEPLWRVGNVLRGRYVTDLGNTPGHLNHWTSKAFVREVRRHLEIVAVQRPLPWTLVAARPRSGP